MLSAPWLGQRHPTRPRALSWPQARWIAAAEEEIRTLMSRAAERTWSLGPASRWEKLAQMEADLQDLQMRADRVRKKIHR